MNILHLCIFVKQKKTARAVFSHIRAASLYQIAEGEPFRPARKARGLYKA